MLNRSPPVAFCPTTAAVAAADIVAVAPSLSVVMPVYDEAPRIGVALEAISPWRAHGVEVLVVDGGSTDDTADRARSLCDRVLVSGRGRAQQMNRGAAAARGDLLLFLHVDTVADGECFEELLRLAATGRELWGRFDVRLDGAGRVYRMIERAMNLRSGLSGIATGDQGIFVSRGLFERIGGYPDIALMEDLALCDRLRRQARPLRLRQRVTASARRWEQGGVVRTVGLMWALRAGYRLGVSPSRLRRYYEDVRD